MREFRSVLCTVILTWTVLSWQAGAQTTVSESTRPTALAASVEPGQADRSATGTSLVTSVPVVWSHPVSEYRGVWVPGSELLGSREKLATRLDGLRSANFNSVLIDTFFRGYVLYPGSRFVPQNPQLNGEDRLGWVIEETRRRGMRAELWMEYGFYAYHTRDALSDKSMGAILDAHPGWVSVDSAGNRFLHNRSFGDYYSLCPANPETHEFLGRLYAEAVARYAADGLNLDRLRFAGENFCYCPYCQGRFASDVGVELKEFAPGSVEAGRFLEWKRARLLSAVETITNAVRAVRPGIAITSYVVPPEEMASKAQSWDLWMKKGLLDGVAVSMYGTEIRTPATRALELIGGDPRKLLCAISCEKETAVYLSNIEVARGLGTLGQVTWHSGAVGDDLEGLGAGPYSKPASCPLGAGARPAGK